MNKNILTSDGYHKRLKNGVFVWKMFCWFLPQRLNFTIVVFCVSDVTLDIDTLTNEQKSMLNQCAQTYGMKNEDFVW